MDAMRGKPLAGKSEFPKVSVFGILDGWQLDKIPDQNNLNATKWLGWILDPKTFLKDFKRCFEIMKTSTATRMSVLTILDLASW